MKKYVLIFTIFAIFSQCHNNILPKNTNNDKSIVNDTSFKTLTLVRAKYKYLIDSCKTLSETIPNEVIDSTRKIIYRDTNFLTTVIGNTSMTFANIFICGNNDGDIILASLIESDGDDQIVKRFLRAAMNYKISPVKDRDEQCPDCGKLKFRLNAK